MQAFRHAILVERRRLPPPELSCFPPSSRGLPALSEAGRLSGLLAQMFDEDPARWPAMAQAWPSFLPQHFTRFIDCT
jgi:hypothetical protein